MEQSKKRKRAHGESDKSSKKHSAPKTNGTGVAKVRHVPREEGLGPIVAYTPGISVPSDLKLTPYTKPRSRRSQILLQSSDHGRLDYIAHEEHAGSNTANMKHYIGVYDPQAGSFAVTECPKVTLRTTLRPTQAELDEEARQRERQTFMSMRMALGQEFGTKKAKKVLADKTVNAISQRVPGETAPAVDAGQQAVIAGLKARAGYMKTLEEIQEDVDASKPRPRVHLDAVTPADVYPLHELIDEDTLALLNVKEWKRAAKKNEDLKLETRFVARRLQAVAARKDEVALKALRYLHILLVWFNALDSKKGGKRVRKPEEVQEKVDAPKGVLEGLKRKFSDGGNLTKWSLDKLILHASALSLHIDNFETDPTDLASDLQLTSSEMSRYLVELGCVMAAMTVTQREMLGVGGAGKEAGKRKIARLRVPVVLPKQKVRAQRR